MLHGFSCNFSALAFRAWSAECNQTVLVVSNAALDYISFGYPLAACCQLKGRARRKLRRPLLFKVVAMRVAVYVDGFNLYYRALDKTPFKWLDLRSLAADLLDPSDQVEIIRYFTARVSGRSDHDQPRRQQVYLNALKTIPGITIHFGHFLTKTKWRPLVNPVPGGPRYAEVHDTEEKGSDVNLATHLIHDGWKDRYDAALVMSQDTDLVEPIRIVRQELNKVVGLVWLDGRKPGGKLVGVASFVRQITHARLAAAQLPSPIMGRTGHLIYKPESW